MIDIIIMISRRRLMAVKRKLSAVEARKKLGEILEGVFYRGDEVVIERAGKPMAVVIPAALYAALEKDRERLFELIEQNWERNKDVSYEEIEKEVAEAVREVRAQRRNQQSAS
jgi:prevent-host-death family protein